MWWKMGWDSGVLMRGADINNSADHSEWFRNIKAKKEFIKKQKSMNKQTKEMSKRRQLVLFWSVRVIQYVGGFLRSLGRRE
jgi:hypothetical protein